jgi:predicted amidohydrolase
MGLFQKQETAAAVIQMRIFQQEGERNLKTAARFIEACVGRGAKLVVLPQAFRTSINLTDLHQSAEAIPGGSASTFLANQAARHKVHLVGGILEKEGADIYDAAVVMSPVGRLIGKYRRRFLWGMEKDFLAPGALGQVIQTDFAKVGLLLGYDLYFPEACRNYFKSQADVLICLANVYKELGSAVGPLCRARAVENHCYFILDGGLGYHEIANRSFMGGSLVACDPLFLKFVLKQPEGGDFGLLCKAADQETILVEKFYFRDLQEHKRKTPQFEDYEFALGRSNGKPAYARLVE